MATRPSFTQWSNRLIVILFGTLLWSCSDTTSVVSDNKSTDATSSLTSTKDSQVNMALSWDWRDDNDYKDYNGNQIPAPWLQESHIGVDLGDSNECQPSDGWRLYIKRMTASDYTGLSSKTKLQSTTPVNPYFVLYNIYTGVMRVFMYLGGDNTVGEDYFAVKTSVEDGPGSPTDLGIFLNDAGNYSYPLSEKNSTLNTDKMEMFNFNAVYKKWLVVDYPVPLTHLLVITAINF